MMSDFFENVSFDDINLDEYNSIDISFSSKQKIEIKKALRKHIVKRRTNIKRSGLIAVAALALIVTLVVSNGSSALAKVMPAFNKLYTSLGFKQEYLEESTYIGKTYEENGIKITLENIIGANHIIKVALKVEYDNKIEGLIGPLILLKSDYEGNVGIPTGNGNNSDENTNLNVINFISVDGFSKKGDLKITAQSPKFNKPMVWDIKVDFSKSFEESIYKNVTMSKDLGITVDSIEANKIGTIISSNKDFNLIKTKNNPVFVDGSYKTIYSGFINNKDFYVPHGKSYFIKVDNKIYSTLGAAWTTDNGKKYYTVNENLTDNILKNAKKISLVSHSMDSWLSNNFKDIPDEKSYRFSDEMEKKLNSFPKTETNGVTYTKEITFNNGKKAEIYKVERENDRIRLFLRGDNKKQVFNMACSMHTNISQFGKSIQETSDGWIVEFNYIESDKVTIEMMSGVLDSTGDYNVDESELLLK